MSQDLATSYGDHEWTVEFPVMIDCTYKNGRCGEHGVARHGYAVDSPFEEIRRNRGVIQERTGLSATAIDELIDRLFKNITFVPEADTLLQYRIAADATSSHPDADQERHFEGRDEDDVVFLAAAIAMGGDISRLYVRCARKDVRGRSIGSSWRSESG